MGGYNSGPSPRRPNVEDYPQISVNALKGLSGCNEIEVAGQQSIAIEWTSIRYGERPYFRCPTCNSRRVNLLLDQAGFSCRACKGAIYRSQSDSDLDNSIRQIDKLTARLSYDPKAGCYVRPPRMRSARFQRLLDQLAMRNEQFRKHLVAAAESQGNALAKEVIA